MGTSPFAVGFLQDLVEEDYHVVAVVTAPDKPQGRGRKVAPSPVKTYALEVGLPVFQPENLREPTFLEFLKDAKPYLGIVVAFRMLPEEVWALPTCGTINVHASLLPRWRGAAPINHSIMAGDCFTGVTIFRLRQELDRGDIIATATEKIKENDNFRTLHDRLAMKGRALFRETLPLVLNGKASFEGQPIAEDLPYATKLTRENTRINWRNSATVIHNFIRGLAPAPGAWTVLRDQKSLYRVPQQFKILEASLTQERSSMPPGSIILPRKGEMQIVAGDGNLIAIEELQAPGKKPLHVRDYLNGAKLPQDSQFE